MKYKINKIEEAKRLIQEGMLREGIALVLEVVPERFQTDIGTISANTNKIYKDNFKGTIDNRDFSLGFAKNSEAVLEIIQELHKHFVGENFYYLFNQAVELNKEKKFDAALDLLDEAYEIDPTNSLVLIERGLAKMNIFLFSEAIIDLSEAIEKKPINPYAFFLRAQAYEAMGYKEKAENDKERFNEFGINFNKIN